MRQNVIVTPVPLSPRTLHGEKIVQKVAVSGHLLSQFQISFSNQVGYRCKLGSVAIFYRTLAKPIYLRKVFAIIGAVPDFNSIIEQRHNKTIE